MRDMRGGPLGVFRAAFLLHYFASYSIWSLRITLLLCASESWRILAPSPPSLLSCGGGGGRYVFHVGKYFPLSTLSVWRCQLAAAGRGGSRFQGCLVTSFAVFFTVGLPANLLGTSSQAHQLAMSLTIIGEKTVPAITTTWDSSINGDLAVKDFDSFRGLNWLFVFLDSKPVKIPGKLPPPDLPGTRFTLILL